MKCLNCQAENPDSARFCMTCGTAMAITCAHCGAQVMPGAKFCVNCGHPVGAGAAVTTPSPSPTAPTAPAPPPPSAPAAPSVAAQDPLTRYIPKELAAKLEAARSGRSMEGERRIVTVLFCDVKGSTAMAEMLDPEEWAEIMNGAFKYIIEPVYRYEGTLARLMGDAILAFFGAPIAHEDDPQRAVLAGLDMLEAIRPYREQLKARRGLDFDVRVGINTGLVVVGEVGSDLRMEYTAMGDAVNLASRMEQAAEPGTVLVSGSTYKQVQSLFEFEELGGIEVKGKTDPVLAYRAVEVRKGAMPTRGIEGLSSPLVGRDRELQQLKSRLDELLTGRGQVVSILGEAGLGKSRLTAELRKSAAKNLALTWLEGRSLSYQSSTPYTPFVDMLGSYFGLDLDDPDDKKYDKVKARVEEVIPGQAAETAPFIGSLLGLSLPVEDSERVKYLEPPILRGRIFQATAGFFEQLARMRPVVLVLEDLHWADPTSLDLLEQLLPLTERTALCIIALFRPQQEEPSWRFHEVAGRDHAQRYTSIALEPLDEANSRTLVANLLEIEDLPEKVRALILRKAEGNPFFVEEVIRSLLDAKLVIREDSHWRATRDIENIAVPDTLAGVITARLDRLEDESKRVAQTASVVGREFQFDVLSAIYEAPPALDGSLQDLQSRELVREKNRDPQRAYLFKHVLTQETAYASILLSRRRELNRSVAECLERVAPSHINDIARHFVEAREEGRALPYLVEAGDRAGRAGSTREASLLYKAALEITQKVDDSGAPIAPVPLARRSFEGFGKALEFAQDIPGAIENYHSMLHYAEERGDAPMTVSALNKMAYVISFMMGQFPEAEQHLAGAESLAREHDDVGGLSELYSIRCAVCMMSGDFAGAKKHLSAAVEMGERTESKETQAYGKSHLSNTLTYMTDFDAAWQAAQDALRISRESSNREREAEVLSFPIPFYHLRNGDLDAAQQVAEQGYELATRIGVVVPACTAPLVISMIMRLRGEYEQALAWAERGIAAARPVMNIFPFMLAMPLATHGSIYLDVSRKLAGRTSEIHAETMQVMDMPGGGAAGAVAWTEIGFCALALGETDRAAGCFERAMTGQSPMQNLQRPVMLAGKALVDLAQHRTDEAARTVREARQYAEASSMKHLYPMIAMAEAAISASDEPDLALEHFARAESLALEMGMRPMVWQARAGAARVLSGCGRTAEAAAKRTEARAMIDEIASLFSDQQMRELFIEDATSKL